MLFRSATQGHILTSFRNAGNEISSVCMHLVNALDKGVILVITSELYIDMNVIDIESSQCTASMSGPLILLLSQIMLTNHNAIFIGVQKISRNKFDTTKSDSHTFLPSIILQTL